MRLFLVTKWNGEGNEIWSDYVEADCDYDALKDALDLEIGFGITVLSDGSLVGEDRMPDPVEDWLTVTEVPL